MSARDRKLVELTDPTTYAGAFITGLQEALLACRPDSDLPLELELVREEIDDVILRGLWPACYGDDVAEKMVVVGYVRRLMDELSRVERIFLISQDPSQN